MGALSLKFKASAKHFLDENSQLKDMQSVKQGIDASIRGLMRSTGRRMMCT